MLDKEQSRGSIHENNSNKSFKTIEPKQKSKTKLSLEKLLLYVNAKLWQEVDSLFGLGPSDECYIVRTDDTGESWIQFGDGKTGRRLPSGTTIEIQTKYRMTGKMRGTFECLKKLKVKGNHSSIYIRPGHVVFDND